MLKPRFAQIWTQITAQSAVETLPSRLARMPNSSFSAIVTGPPSGLNITYQVRPLTVAPSTTGRKTIERTAISPLQVRVQQPGDQHGQAVLERP